MNCTRLTHLSLLLCLPCVSQAAILTFGFEGDVTSVQDPIGVLDFVEAGQRFVYTFSFDTDAPNINPDQSPTSAWYEGVESSLTVGGFVFMSGVPFMQISTPDYFNVGSGIVWDHPGLLPGNHSMYVRLRGGDAVQTIGLPLIPYDLDHVALKEFQITFFAPGGSTGELLTIIGGIDSMYLVPEPSAGLLMILLALTLGRKHRTC